MRRMLALIVMGVVLAAAAVAESRTEGGDVLWEDRFDIVELAASDGRVAAVGTVVSVNGSTTSIIRVYDADKKGLLWQTVVAAESVILDDDRAVVAGGTSVRAFDARTGRPEWSDVAPFEITQLYRDDDTIIATAITAAGALRVRVYDTTHGTVLVPDRTVPAGVFARGRVFVGGRAAIPTGGGTAFPCQVTAYDLATGAQVWQTTQPFPVPEPTTSNCQAGPMIADRKRVIVAGSGHFGDEFMAQGYDAETGAFLWEHLPLIATPAFDAAVAADVERRLVFVAGWTHNIFRSGTDTTQDFVIRALHADTGELRWEARTPGGACPPLPVRCFAHARLLTAERGTVYGTGFQGELNFSIPGTGFLRAYDASSGRLLWEQPVDVEAIGATGGTVVVLTPEPGADEVILRAYDGR